MGSGGGEPWFKSSAGSKLATLRENQEFSGGIRKNQKNSTHLGHLVGTIAGATCAVIKNGGDTSESSFYVLSKNTRVGGVAAH